MTHPPPTALPTEPHIRPPGLFVIRLAIFLSVCGVVLIMGGLLMWLNHAFPNRKNDHLRSIASPDGKLQAVVFRRAHEGKSDAYTTHVTIIPAGEKLPSRSGKAFIAEGEPAMVVRWIDNKHLIVDEPEGTNVILRASQLNDIQIQDR